MYVCFFLGGGGLKVFVRDDKKDILRCHVHKNKCKKSVLFFFL